MNAAPSLRDLQLWLKWIVTDPRGVTEALNEPTPNIEKYKSRYTRPTPSYLNFIASDSTRLTNRLDIYAEAYFSRILESMEKDFARTKKVLGASTFTKIVAEYLKAHPSKFTSVDEVGTSFPGFISEFEDIVLNKRVSDLALFEWSWVESFYAKEVPTDDDWRSALNNGTQVDLQIHPSVHLIQSQWPMGKLIQNIDVDDAIDLDAIGEESKSSIVIYRVNDEVHWEELAPPFFQILRNLKRSMPMDEALSQCEDVSPEAISQNFSRWVERGILYGLLKK